MTTTKTRSSQLFETVESICVTTRAMRLKEEQLSDVSMRYEQLLRNTSAREADDGDDNTFDNMS